MRFLRRVQHGNTFEFAHLQSELAQPIITQYNLDGIDSVIVIEEGRAYIKSDAVFRIVSRLRWAYRWLVVFRIIPRFLRDWMYDILARNREKWFGRSSELTCDFLVEGGDSKRDLPK